MKFLNWSKAALAGLMSTTSPDWATAAAAAKDGDIVLMSPASASFDEFKNFMIRGEFFKKIVKEL